MVGISLLLGAPTSALEGLVQVDGTALRLPAAAFRAALSEMPALLGLLLRYVDAFHVQVSQTVACNGRHQIEQRLARWLLMTHDRVEGDSFTMTQEFMSAMLGVQRPGVTLAIGALQRAGLVQHDKGSARVLDRPGLEAASCECYGIVRQRFDWLAAPH
jgi:CRP-like cAMP-binding protein